MHPCQHPCKVCPCRPCWLPAPANTPSLGTWERTLPVRFVTSASCSRAFGKPLGQRTGTRPWSSFKRSCSARQGPAAPAHAAALCVGTVPGLRVWDSLGLGDMPWAAGLRMSDTVPCCGAAAAANIQCCCCRWGSTWASWGRTRVSLEVPGTASFGPKSSTMRTWRPGKRRPCTR